MGLVETILAGLGIATPTTGAVAWAAAKLSARAKAEVVRDAKLEQQNAKLEQIARELAAHRDEAKATAAAHRDEAKATAAHLEGHIEGQIAQVREHFGERMERVETVVDKLSSGLGSDRQTKAALVATVEQLDKRLERIERRSSSENIAALKGGR